MAYNKLRKLLGMKPKADKTTSEKGITTVTDYFPTFRSKRWQNTGKTARSFPYPATAKAKSAKKPIISLTAGRLSACILTAF